ncbi:peptidase M26 [Prevotella intermedia]
MVRVAFGTTTISGCISDVDITGGNSGLASSLAAGMVQAVADGASVHITDCLVKGSITDNADEDDRAMAGFVFSNNGTYTLTRCLYVGKNNAPNDSYTFGTETGYGATFTDCYYLNPCGKAQGKQVTAERLKSGEMAKLLQGDRTDQVWGQTLGTDNEPLPTTDATKRVYEVKFVYNGEVKATRYATNGQSIHGGMPTFTAKDLLGTGYNPHHYYAIAFEGGFNGSTTVNTDRTVAVTFNKKDYYEIASKEDWKAFCDIVNGGQNAIDAKMTKDVDFGEDIAKVGTSSNPYGGTFDGQNHVLTVNWDAGSANDVAPFGRVNGATIKNLRTEGFIRSNSFYLSGLIDEAAGGNITVANCVSAVNITSSYTSDRCGAGGLISYIFPSARVTINDCLVKGSINATTEKGQKGMGGFVYVQNGACIMNNCLYAGTNNADNSNNNCYTFAPTNTSGATTTLNNCHYLNPCGEAQGTQVTAERLKSGEMAKLLQGDRTENVWGQTLGTDLEPLPTTDAKKRVYQVKFNYNGNEMASRYANNGQGIHGTLPTAEELLGAGYNPKLTYALNFGDFTANTPVTADKTVDVTVTGTFDIASKADWKTFRDIVNGGLTRVDAKLTQDVDLCKEINIVGNSIEQYEGTFDGQGHTLSFDWTSQGGLAPFYFVDGATIKNLRTKGKITTSGGEASGLLGNAYGTTTISNCVSDVEITSSIDWDACEAAGLVQTVAYNGKVTVTDCVVKGNINATTEKGQKGMAGFVYELEDGGACTLTNCLYVGKNNGVGDECYTFAPAGITLNNCYYLNACGKAQGDKITEAQLKNGYVAHKLQAGRTDNVWGQTLGTDNEPQLTTEKAKHVYKVDFKYMDEVKATRYANSGGRVKLPTAKELLGADYDAQKSYTLTFENGFSETTAINGDITVSVTVNVVTGIDGVTDDNSTVRGAVYNLQGVRVAESSDAETLRRLPAGVYIVKGKKFVVR